MDEELQRQYSPSLWNKRLPVDKVVEAHGEFMSNKSDLARQNLKSYLYKLCDEDPEQCIEFIYHNEDIFDTKNNLLFENKKIFVYLHGGYWQWGSVKSSCFMAETFCRHGVIVAAVGYSLAPKVRLTQLVEQVERSVAKILSFSKNSQIFVCGHSAGGHLASMILYTDFEQKFGVKSDCLKAIIPVSGVFDLIPLLKTDINDNLKLDLEEAIKMSPMYKRDCYLSEEQKKELKVMFVYGENESDAFKKQSKDYLSVLEKFLDLKNLKLIELKSYDHFDIIENLSNQNYILTQEIFNLMK